MSEKFFLNLTAAPSVNPDDYETYCTLCNEPWAPGHEPKQTPLGNLASCSAVERGYLLALSPDLLRMAKGVRLKAAPPGVEPGASDFKGRRSTS